MSGHVFLTSDLENYHNKFAYSPRSPSSHLSCSAFLSSSACSIEYEYTRAECDGQRVDARKLFK